ncbi:E3 ubiquitin-protein ligase MARCH6 [Papilio machaon]|uniref:RING-type E3 ubiquitin transferase n=1 Tax=Papilio machaon TaxID=76193 RepID=A0A194R8Y8_PAPMA|nr:E3 ubiquitin-protein ligase MARCH6 [Papilio machaon]
MESAFRMVVTVTATVAPQILTNIISYARETGLTTTMDSDLSGADFCRFCRSEASSDRPLFHPCICTGSIKWIHQECLVQWMRYSRKEICELCGHRFSFMPIYSPDMPRRLPIRDVMGGLVTSVASAVKDWLHYTLVALAWLGIVPLTACRTYRCLFSASLDPVISLPFDIVSAENLAKDVFSGCFVVTCTLFSFIGLVWLREQIMHGGGPDWMERENLPAPPPEEIPLPENNNDRINEVPGEEGAEREEGIGDAGEDALVGDEANWNPMDWDRAAAEELTWARLLGLDGSMVFLEHVFWVVSLNTLFILVFAFCPYHIGRLGAALAGLTAEGPFAGPLTALAGYVLVGAILAVLHGIASLLRLRSAKKALGFCYVVVKVALLSVVEIGVIPLVCGWWLDLCSLSMFDATLKDRESSLHAAPWTLMFIHWLVGMVYVYYFASFILLLREVLRPGVLWFLKNLNDPDFSPVQVLVIPLRVPLEQSPVLFVWQDWALGVLYTKIVCALTMMGPDWTMRRAIEKAYRDGIREMDLKFILRDVAAPLVRWLGLALAVPYALAHSAAPLLVTAPVQRNLLARRVYPALLLLVVLGTLAVFQIRQFKKLYEHIKNDKYLVGQRLVNYDHRRHKQQRSSVAATN